ncbi:uncharacterized protein LOC142180149 [Nicotiana tabacum]|uniref:Uncharacterized protein LOC142180149 n=1 Tax=Nicotiana tabacum TaxID=4097 RepID=A0AC58UCH9_TOBAC
MYLESLKKSEYYCVILDYEFCCKWPSWWHYVFSSAQAVWNDLHELFNKVDGSRSFNLHKEIAILSQGTTSVSVYFSKLKNLWEEFEALVPAPGSQILMMSPTPTVNQTYALIINDEGQKSIVAASGLLGANPAMYANHYDVAMYTKTGHGGNHKFKKNYNIQCDFCKMKGHNKENYYKIVGYPSEFKNRKSGS